jgi:hypothetical protein
MWSMLSNITKAVGLDDEPPADLPPPQPSSDPPQVETPPQEQTPPAPATGDASAQAAGGGAMFSGLWGAVKEFTSALADENKEVIEKIKTSNILSPTGDSAPKQTFEGASEASSGEIEAKNDADSQAKPTEESPAVSPQQDSNTVIMYDGSGMIVVENDHNDDEEHGPDPIVSTLENIGSSLEKINVGAFSKSVASSAFGLLGKIGVDQWVTGGGESKDSVQEKTSEFSTLPANTSAKDLKLSRIKALESTYTTDPEQTPESEKYLSFAQFKKDFDFSRFNTQTKTILTEDNIVKSFHEKLVLLGTTPEDQFWLRYFYQVELLEQEERVRRQLLVSSNQSDNSELKKQQSLDWEDPDEEEEPQEPGTVEPPAAEDPEASVPKVDSQPAATEDKPAEPIAETKAVESAIQASPSPDAEGDGWADWQ